MDPNNNQSEKTGTAAESSVEKEVVGVAALLMHKFTLITLCRSVMTENLWEMITPHLYHLTKWCKRKKILRELVTPQNAWKRAR